MYNGIEKSIIIEKSRRWREAIGHLYYTIQGRNRKYGHPNSDFQGSRARYRRYEDIMELIPDENAPNILGNK